MTSMTKVMLAQASTEQWHDWFRDGLRIYASDAPAARRALAFAPLVIDPNANSPAGEIVAAIGRLPLGGEGSVPSAISEVVFGWAPSYEPWKGGALALQIATRLGSRNLAHATSVLLSKSISLSAAARERLAYLAVLAAESRFTTSQRETLIKQLWQMELLTPVLLARLARLLAQSDEELEELPSTLLRILRDLGKPPHNDDYVHALATMLLRSFRKDQLGRALEAKNEGDTIAEFRSKLYQIVAPEKYDLPWIVDVEQTSNEDSKKIVERTQATLKELGNVLQFDHKKRVKRG